uniref:NADH-ubiquinone oxidoreductase chain 2 n=1 Tax=Echinolaelaps echidninus TaxID=2759148 RepID=A0AB74RXQ9_9ACAR
MMPYTAKFNFMKLLGIIMMIVPMYVMFTSTDKYVWWFSLEINMIGFIFVMGDMDRESTFFSAIMYFIYQAMFGLIMIWMFMYCDETNDYENMGTLLILILVSKMGMFPAHFMVPVVVEGMSWLGCVFFFSLQKVMPLFMLTTLKWTCINHYLVINMLWGLILMLHQISLRKFLYFSSMVHMGWLYAAMEIGMIYWMVYLAAYMLSLLIFLFWQNLDSIDQFKYSSLTENIKQIISMINMSGLPPFIGFLAKFFILVKASCSGVFIVLALMLMISVFSAYVYLTYVLIIYFLKREKFNKTYFSFNLGKSFILILLSFSTFMLFLMIF